jgi:tripartite-type tricarboxylate transporter receptor subunit TctC
VEFVSTQGIAVGHTEQISEIFTASVEHRATANAKPINQVSALSIAELFAYGKANPGKLSYSTPGAGTPPHLIGETFKQRTGLDITHVPYKSPC